GTGDVHLTMAQMAPITGAIIVTTPQEVATADARKAIAMFRMDSIEIPIIGIVENMSFFEPPELPGKRYHLFGKDGGKRLAKQFNIPFLGELPLIPKIGEHAESGLLPEHDTAEVEELIDNVARNIAIWNAQIPQGRSADATA
ncbi:MAG: Mrp/NBP35 family ATP-binding protein, partial [Bacteroidetes bacterium]|nr:Mrp/NBP35 family ATP-binding protein [Bacteroidota bacterium]